LGEPNIYYEIVKVTPPVDLKNEELMATSAVGVNVYEPLVYLLRIIDLMYMMPFYFILL
jgi:hypothetical protein